MAKKKLETPEWIRQGYDSPAEYAKATGKGEGHCSVYPKALNTGVKKKTGKTFKIRECPKCGSDDVGVALVGEEGKKADNWECRKCKWKGKDIKEKELTEDEMMKYLDEKGEGVS